jgi:hypothetical protein
MSLNTHLPHAVLIYSRDAVARLADQLQSVSYSRHLQSTCPYSALPTLMPKTSPIYREKYLHFKSNPQVAIVTGGNTGIGYETTLHLALHNAKVYLGARSSEKAIAAIKQIKAQYPEAQVEFLAMDLTRLKSVQDAAERILAEEPVIDILVCNAGVFAEERTITEDGIEIDFQTNYLGTVSNEFI